MNRIFEPRGYIKVPDGTLVSAFLNATDATQPDVPWGALGEMSVASGRIEPGVSSWIHIHPAVTQVTYVVSGELIVRMKDPHSPSPYSLEPQPGQAVVSEPGTLFQLRNPYDVVAEVLYIVSPSYVFEMEGEQILHDDSILVAKSWEELEAANYDVPALKIPTYEAVAKRAEAKRRLAERKGQKPEPLATQQVASLRDDYDYLAPDGSEIRRLAEGANGGFAHCVLPAGKVSSPVRHRTVEELWYVLEGEGEIWRARDEDTRIDALRRGDSVRIPVGFSFQFRAGEHADLKLLLATMPRWPGPQEAVPAEGEWAPTTTR